MKKALQVAHFRAELSLPDGAAGIGPREACARSFFHCFAKFLRLDRRRPRASLSLLLRGRLENGRRLALGLRRRRLRQRARRELQPAWRCLSQPLPQAWEDLALELPELERPHGRARRDVKGSVTRDPRRPRV